MDETDGDVPNPNNLTAGSICPIDKKSVHRICSGQVVLTLATAVKELLENSIDAGATIIDIKLKDYGSQTIEVSDNGFGVEENNFEGLTLKHHTSKLQDFSDLVGVETFGFRGEALSSLCALSDLCVTTRHKDATVGTRLEFDHNGKITKQTAFPRQTGTTVTLQNLFYTLPVRHKEFQRNVKREFVKLVQILNSYCIISTGVRINCTNQTGKGNRSVVVSSKGNSTIEENIMNVFGPKQMNSLLEFVQKDPNEDVCTEFGLKSAVSSHFKLEGVVSKCEHGQGRSSTDRQFFFINGRPFDSSKISKVVNEVYHQYNRHQYPFVVLKISAEKNNVDVNVTPDKRQVFLEGEKHILATVKASLVLMYEPTTSVLQIQVPVSLQKPQRDVQPDKEHSPMMHQLTKHASLEKLSGLSSLMKLKRSFSSAFSKSDSPVASPVENAKKQRRLDSFISSYSPATQRNISTEETNETNTIDLTDSTRDSLLGTQNNMSRHSEEVVPLEQNSPFKAKNNSFVSSIGEKVSDYNDCTEDNSDAVSELEKDYSDDNIKQLDICKDSSETKSSISGIKIVQHESVTESDDFFETSGTYSSISGVKIEHHQTLAYSASISPLSAKTDSLNDRHFKGLKIVTHENKRNCSALKTEQSVRSALDAPPEAKFSSNEVDRISDETSGGEEATVDSLVYHSEDNIECGTDVDCQEVVSKKEKTVHFSLNRLKNKWGHKQHSDTAGFSRAFRAKINPTDNNAAEQELQREIKKDMFSKMEILGQFNLGFIITKLERDLFIVDQHATDEKFNFETLQRDHVIQSQKLICPMSLDLTASNEIILMDNLDIFRKNGFEFLIDEDGPPTQRVKLVSTPVSKNWNFGKEDIEEMVFMLSESPGVACRPSRVRAMFASRACRKSIMIGTYLNKAEMRKLVCHMGEIEQPWNCPHGRPTMRHLINLDMVPK